MTMPIFLANKNARAAPVGKQASPKIALHHDRRKTGTGFTLVEMMIVIFLVGLATAAVVVNIPGERSTLRGDAEQLAVKLAAARDHAILDGRPMAIWLRPSGYGFERRQHGHWQAAHNNIFRDRNWSGKTSTKMSDTEQIRVVFDVTGLPSAPTDIALQNGDMVMNIRLSASGDVKIVR